MGADSPVISDAVRFGDLLFLSGRAAVDPVSLEVVGATFEEQAEVVLRDIGEVLEAAGALGARDSDRGFPRHRRRLPHLEPRVVRAFEPPRPVRMTLVSGFAVPGILIELQVTVGLPGP